MAQKTAEQAAWQAQWDAQLAAMRDMATVGYMRQADDVLILVAGEVELGSERHRALQRAAPDGYDLVELCDGVKVGERLMFSDLGEVYDSRPVDVRGGAHG